MNLIGPSLAAMTRRIAETPADFLDEPRLGGRGCVAVAALVADVLRDLGMIAPANLLAAYDDGQGAAHRNSFTLAAITSWLLADDWLRANPPAEVQITDLLLTAVPELAEQAPAGSYIDEPDRREELARTMLARLGCRPDGETLAQASDRLSMISTAERMRLLRASRDADARAGEVRAALVRKAAKESADKWTRE